MSKKLDFSLLSQEIQSKKKELQEVNGNGNGSKWKKVGELEKEKLKRLREEEERERKEKEERKRKRMEEEAAKFAMTKQQDDKQDKKKTTLDHDDNDEDDGEDKPTTIPADEVIKRLRRIKQPIRLFGETDWKRERRLRRLEAALSEQTQGQRNDFSELIKQHEEMTIKMKEEEKKGGPDQANEKKKKKRDEDEWSDDAFDENAEYSTKEDYIYYFLKHLLHLWQQELDERPEEVAKTPQGKQETGTLLQTKLYIRPLFTDLKARKVAKDILLPLYDVVVNARQREYVKANDAYLRLAIGNAAWPMGVTMVGIHERSAREKIEVGKVAHVLNDETQRKYVQSVKRLLTYAQKRFPTDPSKMVRS